MPCNRTDRPLLRQLDWESLDSHFDRRDPFRLSLQMLATALTQAMIPSLSHDDWHWYEDEVDHIFSHFLGEKEK